MDAERADSGKTVCERCANAFTCGAEAGDIACWCFAVAALPLDRLQAGGTCLCPECLAAELQKSAGSTL